ncbi:MAG: 2OG-Fe(II) oxygenase [Caulobacteraceae bacterium]|nr:2OG-Fe(II) oxygenase [Caulobacteraceae bacterium]
MSEATDRFQRARADIEADRPVDIAETYRIIEAAAREGEPEALLFEAYALGIGYGCDVDLTLAFENIYIADEAGAPDATPQADMMNLGGDLASWIAPRPIEYVHEAPRIGMSRGFIDAELCAWLVDRARPLQEATLVYDPGTGRPVQDASRTNTAGTFKLSDLNMPLILLRHRIANTLAVSQVNFERTSIFRYEVGQAFTDHADYISTDFSAEIRARGQRPHTFLVYLNEAFAGGQTNFLAINKKFRGGVGDALFWRNVDEQGAPDPLTQHAGDPPTSGEKWLLSQFIRDKAQMPG